MSIPFRYAAHSHYYSPWFRRGPALEDWQAPAPFPTVTVPFAPGDPHDGYPYVRHYPLLEYAAMSYGRSKDHSVQGSLSRAPSPYAPLVPVGSRLPRTEGGVSVSVFDPHDDDDDEGVLDDEDDLDDLTDVLAMRYGAAEAAKKAKPFAQVSELFKPLPSGKTKADELVDASKRLTREIRRSAKQIQQAPLVQPPPSGAGTTAAVLIGGVLVGLGIGFALGRR